MKINHYSRIVLGVTALFSAACAAAQTSQCTDTVEHHRLQTEMWMSCWQDSSEVVYRACKAFHRHAKADNDMLAANSAWICGVMYNLGRMNIHDAYHIVQVMKEDYEGEMSEDESVYFISNMLGHVYSTCGNVPGAVEQFKKSAELIRGTRYEAEGLTFIYLALAHAQLNNDLSETLRWLDEDMKELDKHKDSWNYYRALADAYAIKAIVRFKQKDYDGFRENLTLMEDAQKKNRVVSGDLFLPYARIYKTLLDGDADRALAQTDSLMNLKEQYLLKCDIYRYIGDNDKAFMTQRELMHKRDSITGVMIAENIKSHDREIELMTQKQHAARVMNIIFIIAILLAALAIVLMARNIMIRRRFQRRLMAKNKELRAANKRVTAADKMKTEFIRNVSHEIRTPLNIINGFTQVLTSETGLLEAADRHEVATAIGRSTRQITSLVNKMLALANESTKDLLGQVEDTDGLEICRKALAGMPEVDATKVKVELEDLTDGHTRLCTNGDSLLLMIGNMLENSAKFTDSGFIRLSLSKDESQFHFTVEDTGCGIPADKADTIFDRWVKVDEFKEGLGLGLAYCRETAQKLGGSLRLDKTSEKGTTFVLSLPIILKTK